MADTRFRSSSRRPALAALALAALLGVLVRAVVAVCAAEEQLERSRLQLSRLILHELRPGQRIEFPAGSSGRVRRLVAHVLKRPGSELLQHEVRIALDRGSESAGHFEELTLLAPGGADRVRPDEAGMLVANPVSIVVDEPSGPGKRLGITLRSVEGAEGLLVRLYAVDSLDERRLAKRSRSIEPLVGENLARRAGLGRWLDLGSREQEELLRSSWRKIAPIQLAWQGNVTRAVALDAAPPALDTEHDTVVSRRAVQAGERETTLVHGPNLVRCAIEGTTSARLSATRHDDTGKIERFEAIGEVTVDVPPERTSSVECESVLAGTLAVRARDPSRVEEALRTEVWRVTPERPAIVESLSDSLVLRVTARRGAARGAWPLPIAMRARIEGRRSAVSLTIEDLVESAPGDRYEGAHDDELPSTPSVFYLLVPEGDRVVLRPSMPLDISLAELSGATFRPEAYSVAEGPPPTRVDPPVSGLGLPCYVARRPSNQRDFPADARAFVRVARRIVDVPRPEATPPSFRVSRPWNAGAIVRGGALYEPASQRFVIDVGGSGPIVLPVRIYAPRAVDVSVRVDGGKPRRRTAGIVERVTVPRVITAVDEVRSAIVLGDDLEPGRHMLSFEVPRGKRAWVHLPWASTYVRRPHWVENEFER